MTHSDKRRNGKRVPSSENVGKTINNWFVDSVVKGQTKSGNTWTKYLLRCTKCGFEKVQQLSDAQRKCSKCPRKLGQSINGWTAISARLHTIQAQSVWLYVFQCQTCGAKRKFWDKSRMTGCANCRRNGIKRRLSTKRVKQGDIVNSWQAAEDGKTTSDWTCLGCGQTYTIYSPNILSGGSKTCRKCSLKWQGLSTGKSGKCIRPYQIWANAKQRGVMGSEWVDDFPAFLKFYLDKLGQDLEYFQRYKVPWSHHQIIREDDSKPYGPSNLMVVPFFSERCYHKLTVRYWRKLKLADLLTPELRDSYALFVLTFGLKKPYARLKRKRLNEPHSASNSEWILRR